MTKTLRLADLFVLGRDVPVEGPEGTVTVYLRKINPVDQETVFRRARARQAEILTMREKRDSDEYKACYVEMCDFGDEAGVIEYLISDDVFQARIRAEAELSDEEEWSNDGYLQGLRDAWKDRLSALAAENPDDADVVRVRDELARFEGLIDARTIREAERLREAWKGKPIDELRHEGVKRQLHVQAAGAFVREYSRAQIWKATRTVEDHSVAYFGSLEEVRALAPETFIQLNRAYDEMSVDVVEGKGLPETPPSSPSSPQPDEAETVGSSGPVAVPA